MKSHQVSASPWSLQHQSYEDVAVSDSAAAQEVSPMDCTMILALELAPANCELLPPLKANQS